ncbi:MAG: signal recognition particle protein [candidate division Zixibacteria bacterium]|nr:signal recognition particle protein [Candidatus Tariuqbacter arcticus]
MFEELTERLGSFFRKIRGRGKLTESNISEALREVRRILLQSDVNFRVVKQFIAEVQEQAVGAEVLKSITPGQQIIKIINDKLVALLGGINTPLDISGEPPVPVMVVGLQGSGKTTFCGKLAKRLGKKGKRPMMAAADIYRPAAVEQLRILGESIEVPVFCSKGKVLQIARDAVREAQRIGLDPIIFDTAGRLHIDDEMMDELAALKGLLKPREILFIADGMTGQDAVKSAQVFDETLNFTGIVLTKMDGDARGGAALSIRAVTGKPIKFIGVGEKLDDLEPFHPDRIASRILGMGDVVTLVEKVQEQVDTQRAEKMARQFRQAEFTLEDFLEQIHQIKNMGSLGDIIKMIPGIGSKMKNIQLEDDALKRTEAIILSMTPKERNKPSILNGSRRMRIAKGSGTSVQEVNQLLNQFNQMMKMMKRMKGKGMKGMQGLPFPM